MEEATLNEDMVRLQAVQLGKTFAVLPDQTVAGIELPVYQRVRNLNSKMAAINLENWEIQLFDTNPMVLINLPVEVRVLPEGASTLLKFESTVRILSVVPEESALESADSEPSLLLTQ